MGLRTTTPKQKDNPRHRQLVEIAKHEDIRLLFVGDSITDGWRSVGRNVWEEKFAPLKAANFGIGGDRTENVLWRLRNGVLDDLQPKVAVVLIGTNNTRDSAENVAKGIHAIVSDIRTRSPNTRILLHAIFPRDETRTATRKKNERTNTIISTYADGKNVIYIDISGLFLNDDETLRRDLMPDCLHLSEKGYEIWAEAIIGTVRRMMQDDSTTANSRHETHRLRGSPRPRTSRQGIPICN